MATKINKFAYDIVNVNISNAINKKEKEINDNTIAFLQKKYGKTATKLSKAIETTSEQIKKLREQIKKETTAINGFSITFDNPYSSTLRMQINNYSVQDKHPAIIKAHEEKQNLLMKLALGVDITNEVKTLIATIEKIK